MRHFASAEFWGAYQSLPERVRDLADKNFELLKQNPKHPSLRFKKVGRFCPFALACAIALWPLKRTARTFGSGSALMRTMIA